MMSQLIAFENQVLGDNPLSEVILIEDIDFLARKLIRLPSLRPLFIDKIVMLCQKYFHLSGFKERIIKGSIYKCPIVTYKLFKLGFIQFTDFSNYLMMDKCFMGCFYFRKEILDFEQIIQKKKITEEFDPSNYTSDFEIDQYINFGFKPSTIEYCLKYDDISEFREILSNPVILHVEEAKWSPFEWSRKPKILDLLSFSGFFGSIQCFKHLLVSGWRISHYVSQTVICCGQTELFHMCKFDVQDFSIHCCLAAEYCRLSILEFLIESYGCIDANDADVSIRQMRILYCILDQERDISA